MSHVCGIFTIGQSGEATWWRICYQRGLVGTTQQTAGPVKRVQLQLSGSNPQPTTQRQEARDEINSPVYLKYIVTITFVGPFPKELLTPKDHGVFWDEK